MGRARLIALACAAIALPAPAGAQASVTLGQVAPAGLAAVCGFPGCTQFQRATDAGSPSYTVPAGTWVITSWTSRGSASGSTAALRVFRPIGPSTFQLI